MKPILIALLGLFICLPLMTADKDKPLPKDFKSLKALAEKGDACAQNNLGAMYHIGRGVGQDLKEAVKWIRKAADQGNAMGQYVLAGMYGKGLGVPEDNVAAYTWFNIAAANGFAGAKEYKGMAAKEMTADQIAKAEALSKEMLKQNQKLINKP